MRQITRSAGLQALYLLGVTTAIFLAFSDWTYDDPFVTYRYADNLTRGLGLVYNPGERVLSTTTPLFALLLALLKNIWPDLPRLAVWIGALSVGLGAVCLWEMAHSWNSPAAGWVGLLLYPTFPLLLNTLSSETPLYLAFCLGAFAFYARRQYPLAAICAALAVLTRAEGALVPILLGGDYLIRIRRPIPWSALALFLGLAVPWFLFSWSYFGSPLPATLAAKQQQGLMIVNQRFAPRLLTVAQGYARIWQYRLEAGLALGGLLFAVHQARAWLPFLVWPVAYGMAYAALGVNGYFWYFAPLVPGFLAAAGLGIAMLLAALQHIPPPGRSIRLILVSSGLLYLALAQGRDALTLRQYFDKRLLIYQAVGQWLQANTPPQAAVGAVEVGIIGYYAQRPMVDFAGLIQPDVAKQFTPTSTYEDSARWAIQVYRPAYLALNPTWFPRLLQENVFPYCQAAITFPGEQYGYAGEMVVYQCRW